MQPRVNRHIMKRLAADLSSQSYDVLTPEAAGNHTASDEEQLTFATGKHRAILTFNIRDFAPLHEQWQVLGQSHAGIIVSQQLGSRQYRLLLERLLRLLNHFTAEREAGLLQEAQFSTVSPGMAAKSLSLVTTVQLPSVRAMAAIWVSIGWIVRPFLRNSAASRPYSRAASSVNGHRASVGKATWSRCTFRSRVTLSSMP